MSTAAGSMPSNFWRRPRTLLIIVCWFLAAALMAPAAFTALFRGDDLDRSLYAYFGQRLRAGDRLYRDVWDIKPPGIFWINALGGVFDHGTDWGPAALAVAATVVSVVLVQRIGARRFGRFAGLLSLVLAAAYLGHGAYYGATNRPETYVTTLELAAAAVYLLHSGGQRFPWLVMGALGASAFCFKQTGIAVSGAIVVDQLAAILFGRRTLRHVMAKLMGLGLGWLTGVAVFLAILGLTGSPRDCLFAIFGYGWRLMQHERGGQTLPALYGWREHLDFLALPLILAGTAVATRLLDMAGRIRRAQGVHAAGDTNRGSTLFLTSWFAFAWFLGLWGPMHRLHHFAPMLAPLVLLAAEGVAAATALGRGERDRAPTGLYVMLSLWIAYMLINPISLQGRMGLIAYHRRFLSQNASSSLLAEHIRKRTRLEDRIWIWGYQPDVYLQSRRPPATRFIGTEKAEDLGPGGQVIFDEILAEIRARPPAAISMSQAEWGAVRRGVTPRGLGCNGLAEWIERNYQPDPAGAGKLWVRQ